MNLRDLMSIATAATAAASNKTTANGSSISGNNNNNNMIMNPMQGYGAAAVGGGGEGNPTSSFMNNPLAFLRNIQIGSSNIVNANWNLPQSVTMGLVGMVSSNNSNNKLSSSSSSPNSQTADFIVVSVIPFTGKSISGK
jgi:hypothetical protein